MKFPLYLVAVVKDAQNVTIEWIYCVCHPAVGPINLHFGHLPSFLELKNALIAYRNSMTVVDADLGNDNANATLVAQQNSYFPQAGIVAVPSVPNPPVDSFL